MDHSISHGFLFILLFNSIIFINDACDPSERRALKTFSRSLSSPPLNWTTTSVDCCQWEGLTCDQDRQITRLQLPSKGLNERIISPSSLGNLTHLTHLNLSHNSLYGSLKAGFFLSLNRLEILDLSYNLLSEELSLSQLPSNVQIVDLSSNHFHREIISLFFGHASNLTSFNVTDNSFSKSILSSICLHLSPSIRLFDFSLNEFSGNISRGLGACSRLQVFRVGYNHLSRLLPEDIYNATILQEIALPRNSLHGAISERIVNLSNLGFLDLQSNGVFFL